MAPKLCAAGTGAWKPRVAWIADPKKFGKKPGYPKPSLRDRLQREAGWSFIRVTAQEVRSGALNRNTYDLFVVPGGYAPNFAAELGELGGQRIRQFVQAGGGFAGICAGAYLGSMWGFELLPVNILDIEHWDRGTTEECHIRKTLAGARVAGPMLPDAFSVRYANGPLFELLDSSVEPLLEFDSELRGKKGSYPALMRGSPAAVGGPCGRGRVVLLSPHMEGSPEVADAFRSILLWTTEGSAAAQAALVPPPPFPAAGATVPVPLDGVATGAPTEARLVAALREADASGEGTLERSQIAVLLGSLGLPEALEERLADILGEADAADDGAVRYEELVSWVLGTPWVFGDRAGADTDGEEDAEMDVPSLVRLQSLSRFEQAPVVEVKTESPEAMPMRPSLRRGCSDGCSGRSREFGEAEVATSVVTIQRAARARRQAASPQGGAPPAATRPPSRAVGAAAAQQPQGKAKAAPAPRPGAALLTRGGLEYVCALSGPVLLTAPHSIKLVRGGGDTGEATRNHKRERWTAEAVLTVAQGLHRAGLPASVMFWNPVAGPARGRMDPNYLTASQFRSSPWHRALHRWALGAPGVPLLHVDLHGKVSEKLHLDLGAAPLEELWPQEDQLFVWNLKKHLAAGLDKAMEHCGVKSLKGKQIAVDVDPVLHGFWGKDTVATISHQSALLGIPAVQFEMPPRLREQLLSNEELGRGFAAAIAEAYREDVAPWWAARASSRTPWPRTLRLDPALAADVQEATPEGTADFEAWSARLLAELAQLDKTITEAQI